MNIWIYEGIYHTQQAKGFLQAPKLHSSSKPFCCSREGEREKQHLGLWISFAQWKNAIWVQSSWVKVCSLLLESDYWAKLLISQCCIWKNVVLYNAKKIAVHKCCVYCAAGVVGWVVVTDVPPNGNTPQWLMSSLVHMAGIKMGPEWLWDVKKTKQLHFYVKSQLYPWKELTL